jgi:mannosyl-3-phosphoglycerate phosphatase
VSPRLPRLLVVTDLDGCLLDEATYSPLAAAPALDSLRTHGVPLVLASSKTRSEVAALVPTIGPVAASIVENGGAVVQPVDSILARVPGSRPDGSEWLLELGVERGKLVAALDEIATELGIGIRGFASMTADQIAARTGLTPATAALAAVRAYDEPFSLDEARELPEVVRAAAARGLRVTAGGRFHHLTGDSDKGRALRILLAASEQAGERFITVGLGDSPNDRSLLQSVDRPIVIPRPDGAAHPELTSLPRAAIAPAPGPRGWNAAVLEILDHLPSF